MLGCRITTYVMIKGFFQIESHLTNQDRILKTFFQKKNIFFVLNHPSSIIPKKQRICRIMCLDLNLPLWKFSDQGPAHHPHAARVLRNWKNGSPLLERRKKCCDQSDSPAGCAYYIGGFRYVLCSPLLGEMMQFWLIFLSSGLKPSLLWCDVICK